MENTPRVNCAPGLAVLNWRGHRYGSPSEARPRDVAQEPPKPQQIPLFQPSEVQPWDGDTY
jgi:hypothetical protein